MNDINQFTAINEIADTHDVALNVRVNQQETTLLGSDE